MTNEDAASADGADRYAARPNGVEWCVWDTMQDALVFAADGLTERRAHEMARTLSDAYRRATR